MPCVTCQNEPCACPATEEECPPTPTTKCDLYVPGTPNVWVERGDSPNDVNAPGVCMLDTMEECQVVYILQRDDKARADLLRVTSDERLRELAATTPKLPVVEQADAEQALYNEPNNPGSLPFYAIFRGRPPFAQ